MIEDPESDTDTETGLSKTCPPEEMLAGDRVQIGSGALSSSWDRG